MTDDTTAATITNPDEFEDALAELIESAIEADIDIRGAWEFRTPSSSLDWEVNVTELAKRPDGGDG